MTEGSIWKKIVTFAFPLFLGNLFQQLYNTADSLIVGNFLGSDALAAVSSSGSLIFLMVGFFNGIAMGAGVVVARYYGARQTDRLQRAIHTDVAFGIVAGILLTIIGLILAPQMLVWMGTPADVLPNSLLYFRIYFMGSLAFVLYNVFVGILQSIGDSRHPLNYLILSSIVNIVLDLLFVGVLKLGVGSAALATIISQFISALLCLRRLLRSPEEYRLVPSRIRFDPIMLKQIISNGLPAGLQNSIIALANVVVQSNINSFGKMAVAGCGAYSKVEGFDEANNYAEIKAIFDKLGMQKYVDEFKSRALNPEHPIQKGTAQNGDTYFQNRETANSYYEAVPAIVSEMMKAVSEYTGRAYHLFDYVGASDAEEVIVVMGSGAETIEETVNKLNAQGIRVEVDARSEKIGKKIREATLGKVPYMLVVGDRDMENATVSVRTRGGEDLGAMSQEDFAARVLDDVKTKRIW